MQDQIITETPATNNIQRWSLAKRIGFRFAFAFLILFILTFPAGDFIPFTDYLAAKYASLWNIIDLWVAKHLLHITHPLVIEDTGSGDRTADWIQVLCFVALAAGLTLIWSLLDRKRENYRRLYLWLRLFVRFSLASVMITYGAIKIIPLQMPSPSLTRLLEPYGDSSPMGLLWTFIGASKAYSVFVGSAEMLGGVLLIFPRTTALGALVSIGDMTQVFVLNMCYDVPVKLFSIEALLMGVFLIAPHLPRLVNLFLLKRPAEPLVEPPLFTGKWPNRAAVTLQVALGLFMIGSSFHDDYKQSKEFGDYAPKPALYGIWTVEQFSLDGEVRPPVLTDGARWRRVVIPYTQSLSVQAMDDTFRYFKLDLNARNKTIALAKRDDPNWKAELTFQNPEASSLILDGQFEGHKIHSQLKRFQEPNFLLLNRGFHWIQEYPFNR